MQHHEHDDFHHHPDCEGAPQEIGTVPVSGDPSVDKVDIATLDGYVSMVCPFCAQTLRLDNAEQTSVPGAIVSTDHTSQLTIYVDVAISTQHECPKAGEMLADMVRAHNEEHHGGQ